MYADDVNLTLKRELTELIPRHTSKYLQALLYPLLVE